MNVLTIGAKLDNTNETAFSGKMSVAAATTVQLSLLPGWPVTIGFTSYGVHEVTMAAIQEESLVRRYWSLPNADGTCWQMRTSRRAALSRLRAGVQGA